jgi:hypothetical protein
MFLAFRPPLTPNIVDVSDPENSEPAQKSSRAIKGALQKQIENRRVAD